VRPVNLLPVRYRARTAGSGDSKPAYIALGALGLLVLAVFGYVMTANKVSSQRSEIAQAEQQIATAEAQSVTLSDFGDFAAVKQARLSAVRSLATSRLDWERLFRELARVLPEGVWLTGFEGQSSGGDSAATAGGTTGPVGPGIILKGCADDHRQVADVMVRLRELHVAQDVELTKTAAAADEEAGGTGAPAGATASDAACGHYYSFEINVQVAVTSPDLAGGSPEPVPASLGGGG
jgi:Tfp pilus assembly protein PilN